MQKYKRTVYILIVFCAVNLCIIWGHSLLPSAESSHESSGLLSLMLSLFHIEVSDSQFGFFEIALRKCAHFTEFACLGALSIMLTYFINGRDINRTWSSAPLPILCCLFAASTDETIQIFSGRGNSVSDILLDFSGSLFAIAVFFIVILIIKRKTTADTSNKPY